MHFTPQSTHFQCIFVRCAHLKILCRAPYQIERALLEEALRTGVDSSEGMDVVTVVYGRFRSLLPCLHRKNPGQQEEGDENDLGKEEGGS